MKKSLLTIAMLLVATAWAQAETSLAVGGQEAPAQQKKEIKDPAEYNAYINAINATDPNAKVAALEGFLQQYPNSVVKSDALVWLMRAYQATGNAQKTVDAAQRVLQGSPNDVSALALLAFVARNNAGLGQNVQQNAQQAGEFGRRGLEALKTATPAEGQTPADFDKFKTQLAPIFAGAVGFAALQVKDYPTAQQAFQQAVEANPTDLTNVYPLAVAYLEPKPPSPLGLYYGAHAVNLAAADAKSQAAINQYVRAKYIRYHGGEDGYQELLAQAKQSPLPPAGFTVKPAPSPAEQAAIMLQKTALKDMGFADFQFILTSGNQQAADQLWSQIKDKPIQLEAKLITGTASKLAIAGSADDIEANKADIDLTMSTPIPAKGMPAVGTMVDFQGTPVSYEPSPFMVHMDKGIFVGKTKKDVEAAGAPKKPAAATPHRTTPKK